MGIVKISEEIHDELREASRVFDRSLNSQAEHWIKDRNAGRDASIYKL